jgi:HlyD family secretion protein
MKRIIPWFFGLIIVGGLAYTLYFLFQKSQQKPTIFNVEQASYRDIVNKTVATGSIEPREEVDIKPQISGIISSVFVEPGDVVSVGDEIAKIQVIPDMSSLNSAENRVRSSELELQNAKIEFDRALDLKNKGAMSLQDFQGIELRYRNAEIDYQNAKDNLEIVRDGATAKSGKTAITLVKSTVSGMVLQVPVKEGNQVIESNNFNDGTTIATVADMSDMIFLGKIDESEVGKISVGMPLRLTIGAIESETYDATLEYVSPKGILENGAIQFEIKANVTLQEGRFIRAGYSANADIVLNQRDSVLSIDEKLLQFDDDKNPYVEIEVGDQKFEKREVELGLSDGLYVEVVNGVTMDDNLKIWNQPTN